MDGAVDTAIGETPPPGRSTGILQIRLFGCLDLRVGEAPVPSPGSARAESLLGCLVLHRGVPQSREHLAFQLWPDSTRSQARTNLRHVLHRPARRPPSTASRTPTASGGRFWTRSWSTPAAEAGAEVRPGLSVPELLIDDGRVTGIRGRAGGPAASETARIVIGADGIHSLVARAVGAPTYREHPTLTCAYYSYWSGGEVSEAELYARPSRQVIAAPTNDGQVMVIAYRPRAEFPAVRRDVDGHFSAVLDLVPRLGDRLRAGTRTEPFRGTGHLPNFFRRPHGDGWALVGDAGYHKDPILALGISDAFRDAALLAEAIDAGLTGRQSMADALGGYQRCRDEAASQGYENTVQLAALQPPPPQVQQLMTALEHDREQTGRFFGTMIGTVPAAELFDPANLSRLLDRHPPSQAMAGVP